MDASSSMSKRPPDPTTTMTRESIAKRRHLPTEYSVFRLLCPATKTASLAGHIRRVQVLTNTKIHINSLSSSSDEDCVIHIVSDEDGIGTTVSAEEEAGSSPAQQALLRIFERMVRENGDEEQKDKEKEGEGEGDSFNGDGVCCRLLAESNQVGCVLGRGGKIVEKIRHQSGAQVRVFPEDHLPPWASPTDELIQITGTFSAVKKALLSVSSCLLDNPKVDAVDSGSTRPSLAVLRGISVPSHVDCYPQDSYASSLHAPDYHFRDYSSVPGPENIGNNHRMVLEEEVVFKLLCQQEKVGSLIGKGGCIIRALQNETGALIKIADATPDSDERVVVISARENFNQKHSSAQEAVIRVHCRIAEIGFEPGAAVVARLLVHPQQTGCLLGKGGFIINEMRRSTGASIRIFPKEQVLKFGSPNDVVQVIGSLQSVQDALFHITSRLRETIFPMKILPPNLSAPPYFSPFPEIPSMFRSRHAPASPGNYASPVAHPHGYDRSAFPLQSIEHHHPTFSQGMGHNCPTNMDRVPYSDRNERPGHGHFFDQPSSPRSWTLQAVGRGNHWGTADVLGSASKIGPVGSGNQLSVLSYTNTEIRIPQILLRHVRGENNSNLTQIQQTSGAKVLINDAEPGTTEGVVIVSGTPGQTHAAQSLIQAFIFCGQTAPST